MYKNIIIILLILVPVKLFARYDQTLNIISPNIVNNPLGIAAVVVFIVAYLLIFIEDFIKLSKSRPVIIAAGIIWILLAASADSLYVNTIIYNNLNYIIIHYTELLFFLLVTIIYINLMEERNIFIKLFFF